LRPLRTRLEQAKEQEQRQQVEIQMLQRKVTQLEDDILQRDAMVQELMQHESTRLSTSEVRRTTLADGSDGDKANKGKTSKTTPGGSETGASSDAKQDDRTGDEAKDAAVDGKPRPKVTGKNLLEQKDTAHVPSLDEQADQPVESGASQIRKVSRMWEMSFVCAVYTVGVLFCDQVEGRSAIQHNRMNG
jgi:hypothetical protein